MEAQRNPAFKECLDDLCVRFLLNLPPHELAEFNRIGTHIEEAHWFYLDNMRPARPELPMFKLKGFSLELLAHCPLMQHCTPETLSVAFDRWKHYKSLVPVGGLILLNDALDSVLLVRGFKSGSSWMFPRGKVNQGEDDLSCAIRETFEETGFNAEKHGVIPQDRQLKKLEQNIKGQKLMLFIVPNVPMGFPFEPQVTGEIGDIKWHRLRDLPGWNFKKKKGQDLSENEQKGIRTFQVTQFLVEVNKWVKNQRRLKANGPKHISGHLSQAELEDNVTEEEEGLAREAASEDLLPHKLSEMRVDATMELNRLLNIQPVPPGSQATLHSMGQGQLPSHDPQAAAYLDQDKGRVLLALLQQKQDLPQQLLHATQANSHGPSIAIDHIHNVAPQPHNPQYHMPTQRVPLQGSYQAQPPFVNQPAQQSIENQLLSVLGVSKPVSDQSDQARWQQPQTLNYQQVVHHQQATNHQAFKHQQALSGPQALDQEQALNEQQALHQQAEDRLHTMGSASFNTASHTPSDQPLARQGNHILTDPLPPAAGSLRNGSVQTRQQYQFGSSTPELMNLPQQLVANLPKRPEVLDKDHLALLSAFKKGPSPLNGTASTAQFQPPPLAGNFRPGQQQQLSSANATGLGSPYAGASRAHLAIQNGTQGRPISHVSPQLAMAGLRPRKATPLQQHALLSLLGQPSASSPKVESARPVFKENGAPNSLDRVLDQQQQSAGFSSRLESPLSMPQVTLQASNPLPLLYDAPSKNVAQRTPKQQFASHSAQQTGAFRVDGASSDGQIQMLASPLTSYAGGSPYNNPVSPVHVGLQTPLPRAQEANPQRQQTLLSLFGKSPAGAAPVLRNEDRQPAPVSQAHISSANEKFLLDYLNDVTSSAK